MVKIYLSNDQVNKKENFCRWCKELCLVCRTDATSRRIVQWLKGCRCLTCPPVILLKDFGNARFQPFKPQQENLEWCKCLHEKNTVYNGEVESWNRKKSRLQNSSLTNVRSRRSSSKRSHDLAELYLQRTLHRLNGDEGGRNKDELQPSTIRSLHLVVIFKFQEWWTREWKIRWTVWTTPHNSKLSICTTYSCVNHIQLQQE